MFNLFDLLQAQGGMGANGFGQQFGLSPDQTRNAMEALMPALTLGLQKNAAADPTGFTQMFNFMDAGPPTGATGNPQMDAMIRQLFGSQHLSQAVLQQAASVSGVATPALKQMLPVMAGMVVAGIVHVMMNQTPSAPAPAPPPMPFGLPANPYWTEMMNAFLAASATMMPGAAPAQGPSQGAPRGRTNPASLSFAGKPNAVPASASPAPFDLLQQMFQSGLEAQQENAKTMQSLFDSLWRDGAGPKDGANAKSAATSADSRSQPKR